MNSINIGGKECHIHEYGTHTEAVVILGSFHFPGSNNSSLLANLETLCKGKNFALVLFYVSDWNAEFSPWEACDSRGDAVFSGKGLETLDWMKANLLPYLKQECRETCKYYIAGYSLSGLFALWSFYESGLFHGAASCSGSLWMDGWDHYIRHKQAPAHSAVYLSLGGKEEKTKDAKMALVGDRTRQMEKFLLQDPGVERSVLEWNKGGHFADSGKRLAKGIAWLL